MAEFQEVMKQWGRICTQHCAENADDCDGCLLGGTRADVCGSYAKDNAEDAEELERLVMEWATEHPEPEYPTFAEWLNSIGVTISDRPFPAPNIPVYVFQVGAKMFEPIPADLAEKLGLKPK